MVLFFGRGPAAKLYEDNSSWVVQRRAFTTDSALLFGGMYLNVAVQVSASFLQQRVVLARLPIFMAAFVFTGSAAGKQTQMLQDHNYS
jgi:hypothetical protein